MTGRLVVAVCRLLAALRAKRRPRRAVAAGVAPRLGCAAGWVVPFVCDKCGTHNNADVDDQVRQVELIRWAGEWDVRFRWVLRLWCDQCFEPSTRPVSDVTARLWSLGAGVPVEDMWAPTVTDDVAAAILGGER